jgi:hypothetical protein
VSVIGFGAAKPAADRALQQLAADVAAQVGLELGLGHAVAVQREA